MLHEPDAMTAPAPWPPAEGLALPTKYELDPFQKHAVLGIHAGHHVFVTAKTGSGKTFVGEYLIARCLAAGKRVFYTTPIKSLSNQKYHDLKKLFPEATVGILTGDIKMCPDAQIIVMTAEILRNLFYKRGTQTEGVGLTATVSLEGVAGVVMDEVHYIQDPDRGHVWEETLILAPSELQFVLLSATMPSAADLGAWIARVTARDTVLLSTTYRIVPLVHGVLERASEAAGGWRVRPLLDTAGRWISDGYTGWLQGRKAIADAAAQHKKAVEARRAGGYSSAPPSSKVRVEDPVQRLKRTIGWLETTRQLPALFFVFSRKQCERLAALTEGSLLDSSDTAAVDHIIGFHLSRYRDQLETMPSYHTIRELLLRGIAFHHSGLLPVLKEIVELLFARGYVKVLFATETFSVGLNMPTKTVVFLELEKWSDGGQKRLLRPDEYIQMAGRAGRRGIDTQGLVLYEPFYDPVDSYGLKGLMTGALPPLSSRMRFHYDFVLRDLLTEHRVPLIDRSYWAQQQRLTRVARGAELGDLERQIEAASVGLKPDYIAALQERESLEAAVTGSVNAKRKKAEAALRAWDLENEDRIPRGQAAIVRSRWAETRKLRAERDRVAAEIAAWDSAPLVSLGPLETCLERWGFVTRGAEAGSLALRSKGVAATEVNEGHALLMTELAFSGLMDPVPAEEIPVVLATFLREGKEDENCEVILDLGTDGQAALDAVVTWAHTWAGDEDRVGFSSPPGYWSLSTLWPAIVSRWISGARLTEIASEFGQFEGNIQRGLLRIANILEEWAAIATVRRDLTTLEKLRSARFLRDEIIVDSLYLRL